MQHGGSGERPRGQEKVRLGFLGQLMGAKPVYIGIAIFF